MNEDIDNVPTEPLAPPPGLTEAPPTEPVEPVDAPPQEVPATEGTETPEPQAFNLDEYIAGVKVDEGMSYEFDQDLLKEVAPVANEAGISPENLSKLANLLAKRESDMLAKTTAAQTEFRARQEAYVKEMDAQVEALKKDNPQFEGNVRAALNLPFVKDSVFMKTFLESELSHDPVVLQILERAGRTIAPDAGDGANAPAPTPEARSLVDILTGGRYK